MQNNQNILDLPTLKEIKQEAKKYGAEHNCTHAHALNEIAKKYRFSEYRILKSYIDKRNPKKVTTHNIEQSTKIKEIPDAFYLPVLKSPQASSSSKKSKSHKIIKIDKEIPLPLRLINSLSETELKLIQSVIHLHESSGNKANLFEWLNIDKMNRSNATANRLIEIFEQLDFSSLSKHIGNDLKYKLQYEKGNLTLSKYK